MVCFKFLTRALSIALINSLSSLPLCGIFFFFSIVLMSRYDESSSHPYLRVGRTHGAPQGQRQSQALPGIWGEVAKGSKVKGSAEYWFLSDCIFIARGHKSPRFPPGEMAVSFLSSLFFRLVDNAVVLEQLLKYRLFLATYFLLLYWQPKDSCHFQLYEISLDGLCVTLRNAVSSHFWLNKINILL